MIFGAWWARKTRSICGLMVICSRSTGCVLVITLHTFSYLVYLLKTLRVRWVFGAATQADCVKSPTTPLWPSPASQRARNLESTLVRVIWCVAACCSENLICAYEKNCCVISAWLRDLGCWWFAICVVLNNSVVILSFDLCCSVLLRANWRSPVFRSSLTHIASLSFGCVWTDEWKPNTTQLCEVY